MKITIEQSYNNHCHWIYNATESTYTQEQFDYIFKYLDFDKLYKYHYIRFTDNEIERWFCKTYINSNYLKDVYNDSQEGYEWLKQNWGKGVFKIFINYPNKQEFKTIVNKLVNIEFKN